MGIPAGDLTHIVLRIIWEARGDPVTLAELTKRVRTELAYNNSYVPEPLEDIVREELALLKVMQEVEEESEGSFSITSLGDIFGMGIVLPSKAVR